MSFPRLLTVRVAGLGNAVCPAYNFKFMFFCAILHVGILFFGLCTIDDEVLQRAHYTGLLAVKNIR